MIRTFQTRVLSALALAMVLPIAAYAAQGTAAAKSATTHKTHAHMASHTKRPAAIDINTASKEELMTLPGVTDEIAQKIIDNRPYKSRTDLTKKQVLTRAEYTKVRGRVIAKRETKTPETKSMQSTPGSK